MPLIWLDLFSLPAGPVVPEVESSWSGALIHFAARGFQFGKDVIFTYGPFGHLVSPVYTGELFSTRVTWELLSQTIFLVVFGLTLIHLPKLWRPIFLVFVGLFIWIEGTSDALYFLIISCLVALLFKRGPSSTALNIFAGAFFAIFALIKFTFLVLVFVALVCAILFYCLLRRFPQATLIGLIFVSSFLLYWWIAGQEFRNLFSYLETSYQITSGYKEAMALPGIHAVMLAGISAALLGLFQGFLLLVTSRHGVLLYFTLFLAAETILSWQRAFIRPDYHVFSFFCSYPVVLLTIWVVARPKPILRWIGYGINLLVFAICVFGISRQLPGQVRNSVRDVTERVKNSWKTVTHLGAFTDELRTVLRETQNTYALSRVQTEVRDSSIDFLGNEQAMVLLNKLNYTPRPVFQGYSAYTPKLIELNTSFYRSNKAPAYVLFKPQSIDDRYPTLDDAGVLKELLYNYKPLLDDKGYSLWKRMPPAKPVRTLPAVTESLAFDSEHSIPPNQILWLELGIRRSFAGRSLSPFYKPPQVTIRVIDSLGQEVNDRLIPLMASDGFIISPNLRSSWHFLRAASGTGTALGGSFLVHVPNDDRWYFQPTMTCRMTPLPAIPTSNLDQAAKKMSEIAMIEMLENCPRCLPQPFDASKEVLLDLNSQNHFEGVSPLNQTQITSDGEGLRIKSTDPQILLPLFPRGSQGGVMLRIDLLAPTNMEFQLSFLSSGASDYASYGFQRFIGRGKNSLLFFLADSQVAGGRIRLDAPMLSGDYVITRVEARAVSPESVSDR